MREALQTCCDIAYELSGKNDQVFRQISDIGAISYAFGLLTFKGTSAILQFLDCHFPFDLHTIDRPGHVWITEKLSYSFHLNAFRRRRRCCCCSSRLLGICIYSSRSFGRRRSLLAYYYTTTTLFKSSFAAPSCSSPSPCFQRIGSRRIWLLLNAVCSCACSTPFCSPFQD